MIEDVTTLKLFYPTLFFTIGIILICLILAAKSFLVKVKDCDIFNKSNDNAKEITLDINNKFSKAHTEIVAGLPIEYHKELHCLEKKVKDVESQLILLTEDINKKLDLIFSKITNLENKK